MTELKSEALMFLKTINIPPTVLVSEYFDKNMLIGMDGRPLTRKEFEQLRNMIAFMLEINTYKLRNLIRKIVLTCDNGLMKKIFTEEMLGYSFVSVMGNVIHIQVLYPEVLEDTTPYKAFATLL